MKESKSEEQYSSGVGVSYLVSICVIVLVCGYVTGWFAGYLVLSYLNKTFQGVPVANVVTFAQEVSNRVFVFAVFVDIMLALVHAKLYKWLAK